MKIKISKGQIFYGVGVVQNAVSIKSSLPVLMNILLEVNKKEIGEKKLRLTATDLETTIKCTIPVEVDEDGGITLPAKLFSNIIKELPEKEVVMQIESNNNVKIKCEKSVFNIFGLPISEFPVPATSDEKNSFDINANILKEMIRKTKFAISTDETRYTLNGVCFALKENQVKMIATDGHRLAYIKEEIPLSMKEEINIIVPNKVLNELLRLLPEEGEKVKISFSKNFITFNLPDDISITSRLIEGTFPNYEQVIPKETDKQIKVNTQSLLDAVRRASILSDEKSNLIKLKAEKASLIVIGSAPSSGELREEVEIELKGSDIEVGFNAKYIIDVLKAIDTEEIIFEMSSPASPVLMKPHSKDAKDKNYMCVVMPVRL